MLCGARLRPILSSYSINIVPKCFFFFLPLWLRDMVSKFQRRAVLDTHGCPKSFAPHDRDPSVAELGYSNKFVFDDDVEKHGL